MENLDLNSHETLKTLAVSIIEERVTFKKSEKDGYKPSNPQVPVTQNPKIPKSSTNFPPKIWLATNISLIFPKSGYKMEVLPMKVLEENQEEKESSDGNEKKEIKNEQNAEAANELKRVKTITEEVDSSHS